jgi:hypothetical protein
MVTRFCGREQEEESAGRRKIMNTIKIRTREAEWRVLK